MLTILFSILFPYLNTFLIYIVCQRQLLFCEREIWGWLILTGQESRTSSLSGRTEYRDSVAWRSRRTNWTRSWFENGRFLDEGPTVELYFSIHQAWAVGELYFAKKERENKGAMNYRNNQNTEVDCPRTAQGTQKKQSKTTFTLY